MKFVLLHVNSGKEKWSQEATNLYTEKIKHFVPFEMISLTSKKLARAAGKQKAQLESGEILEFLKSDDYVVLFDELGKSLSSEKFAECISRIQVGGKKRCVWIIGGAFGVSEELKGRAQLRLSLAPFVLNHLVAQTVALEQIYRAFTIIKGLPYHNA